MAINRTALLAIVVMWSLALIGTSMLTIGILMKESALWETGLVVIGIAVLFGGAMAIKEMADEQ